MADLAIMVGLPLSGKSTYAKKMKEEEGWTILCPDEFRLAIYGQEFFKRGDAFVWATVEAAARALLATDHKVLIDATNSTVWEREKWRKIAAEYGIDNPTACVMCTPVKKSFARAVVGKPHMTPVIERMWDRFQKVSGSEGFRGDCNPLGCHPWEV